MRSGTRSVDERLADSAPAHWLDHHERAHQRRIDLRLNPDATGGRAPKVGHQIASGRPRNPLDRQARHSEHRGDAAEVASLLDDQFTLDALPADDHTLFVTLFQSTFINSAAYAFGCWLQGSFSQYS